MDPVTVNTAINGVPKILLSSAASDSAITIIIIMHQVKTEL